MMSRGRVKMKNLKKVSFFMPIYYVVGIFIAFIGVFISVGLKDYSIYNSHSWMETEAHFVNSEEYQKLDRQRKHTGSNRYHTVSVTRYRWEYSYEINGRQYYFTIDNKKENEPERQTKDIIVAEDDYSLYLTYSSGENLKVMLIFFAVIGILAGSVIVVLIVIERKLLRKKTDG